MNVTVKRLFDQRQNLVGIEIDLNNINFTEEIYNRMEALANRLLFDRNGGNSVFFFRNTYGDVSNCIFIKNMNDMPNENHEI